VTGRPARRWRGVVALAVVALVSGGCSIRPDSAPRDVSADRQEDYQAEPVGNATSESGNDRIFLIGPDDHLRAVLRPANGTVTGRLQRLIEGPNQSDRERGLRSVLPPDLDLLSVNPGGDVITIDLGPQISQLSAADTVRAIGQIVYTASQLNPEAEVVIKVEGKATEWPNGAGVQQSGALTIYDFFGLAESSQPDFPQP